MTVNMTCILYEHEGAYAWPDLETTWLDMNMASLLV